MSTGPRYLLGIDAGTSVIKVALFDQYGREVGVAGRPHALLTPQPGWVEADMNHTWHTVATTIQAALVAANATGDDVAALGVSGNMVGLWPINGHGEPVRRAILWNDGRTQELIARLLRERPSLMSDIFALSGSVMQQGCTLPLLRWLRDNEPDALAGTAAVLCCKDWLRFKLTGTLGGDPTEASVAPGDARTRGYSDAVFDLLGVADVRHLLPPLALSEATVGTVTAAAAQATGLRVGTPVVTGAGDVPTVALGVGAVAPGDACTVLGTTCISSIVVATPTFLPPNVGLLFCLPGGNWLRAFANIAGTTNLDWFAEQLCPDVGAGLSAAERFAQLAELAAKSEPGARGLLYHPYLSSVGVIAPFVEPTARAQFFGLTLEHRRADLLRAVYEGVAFAIRDCYGASNTPPRELRLAGGGARSAFWCQLIADIVGVPIRVPASQESGALGAALLAGVGIEWFPTVAVAAQALVATGQTFETDPARHTVYEPVFHLYQAMRGHLLPLWQQRATQPTAL